MRELVLSPTFQFCCLWNSSYSFAACNSSCKHIYLLNIPLCPLLFILTQQELPWFVRLAMWSLCLMAISHVYKLSQTTFVSQSRAWNTTQCSSAELLLLALPAKGSDGDRENTKQIKRNLDFYWVVRLSIKRVLQRFLHKCILLSVESYRLICFLTKESFHVGEKCSRRDSCWWCFTAPCLLRFIGSLEQQGTFLSFVKVTSITKGLAMRKWALVFGQRLLKRTTKLIFAQNLLFLRVSGPG